MKLHHRGLTVELEAEDPRVPIIEALLFGRSLPAPFPVPEALTMPPSPPGPAVEVPEPMRRYWEALIPLERRELVLLSERAYRAADLEAALGVTQLVLMGRHSRMAKLARRFRVPARVRARGRVRSGRSYYLDAQSAAWLRALASEPPPKPVPLF